MISFYHSLGGFPGAKLTELVRDYNNSTYKSAAIELVEFKPELYQAAALNAVAAAPEERPDLVLAPEYLVGTMQEAIKNNIAISVANILDEDRKNDIADIVKTIFTEHCLPLNPACGVLYMNTEILQKCGYAADWSPKTFAEFIDACRDIKAKTGISHVYSCAWPEAYLAEAVTSCQDEKGNYTFSHLKDHIIEMRKLTQERIFLPPNTGNYDPTRKPFVEGTHAFYMQGTGHAVTIGKESAFKVGYAPLPPLSRAEKEIHVFPLGGAAIWVLNKSEAPFETKVSEGVRVFLNYLASKDVQLKWHKDTCCVPVSKSMVEENEEFYKQNPLHNAVIQRTVKATVAEYSSGVKRADYKNVRPQLYPLIRELILLEESDEDAEKIIETRLKEFDARYNSL